MNTATALAEADDEMFRDIDRMSLSTLIKKYGGIRPASIIQKGPNGMDMDLEAQEEEVGEDLDNDQEVGEDADHAAEVLGDEEEAGENAEEEATETPEEELAEEEEEEGFTIDDVYDLAEALVSGQFMGQVDKVRTFDEFGLGFLGSGVVAHINGVCYQLAIRMAQSGSLVDQAIQDAQGGLNPEDAFEGDVKNYLEDEPLPGLTEVRNLSDVGDPAGCCGASFLFDDGSDFRVYVLGSSSEHYDIGSMIDDMTGSDMLGPEVKADQACMRKIWAEFYKYYSGKYISAAMQAWSAGNYPMASAAFAKARDGFQQDKNPAEYNCLEAWRQEADNKASA
jgi:hypothetical protein